MHSPLIYNADRLDFKSEILKFKIQENINISEEYIKDNLNFITTDDFETLQKFKTSYGKLWDHILRARLSIDNDNFDIFALICARINIDATLQEEVALHLLFENVHRKIYYDNQRIFDETP